MAFTPVSFEDFDPAHLYCMPLGGQNELGLVSWAFVHQSKILLVDAGAAYPAFDLPGVDLLLPNTAFLEANQDKIVGLALTNGHEEHLGAFAYFMKHLSIPRIMGPRFVGHLIRQEIFDLYGQGHLDQSQLSFEEVNGQTLKVGPFLLEWIAGNNSIYDAYCLKISTQAGTVLYTSGFKLEQTPLDGVMLDIGRLAACGDEGVMLLISSSVNVEEGGYSASEKTVLRSIEKISQSAEGRLIVVMPATNTHRLKVLFEVAKRTGRKVFLQSPTLHKVAVSAAISGYLTYDRNIEGEADKLDTTEDRQVLILESSKEADPIDVLQAISRFEHPTTRLKVGDTIVFSSDVVPGQVRRMAHILDELLALSVPCYYGNRQGVNVSRYGAREELKLMLSITKPRYFAPAMGESRHIVQHGNLGEFFNLGADEIFNLQNGDVLEMKNGYVRPFGRIEAEPVLFNCDQGERVTTASIKERQALSVEGFMTLGLTLGLDGKLLSGPNLSCGASGFLLSDEWPDVRQEIEIAARAAVTKVVQERINDERDSGPYMRSAVREAVVKVLRNRMGAKTTVQVQIHQVGN
ncbi:MAG: Ribonuclease J 1 [bacterium ADurb.Bin425]|nr:MAG: Ribonuclease J 1 [bacterium ADurb.Bin425]